MHACWQIKTSEAPGKAGSYGGCSPERSLGVLHLTDHLPNRVWWRYTNTDKKFVTHLYAIMTIR